MNAIQNKTHMHTVVIHVMCKGLRTATIQLWRSVASWAVPCTTLDTTVSGSDSNEDAIYSFYNTQFSYCVFKVKKKLKFSI